MFTIWPISSHDYASKTRIEILCKKTCPTAPHFFLSLISFEFLGIIEPWPKCQPEASRLGSRLVLNLSGMYRGDDWRESRESGAESVGYIGGLYLSFVSVVSVCLLERR